MGVVANVLIFFLFYIKAVDIRYFWHITDAHVDQNYTTGANPNCNQNENDLDILLCCQTKTDNQTQFAGLFATPESRCDIPMRTYQGSLDFMKRYQDEEVFYTGDSPAHDEYDQSFEGNRDEILFLMKMITNTLGPKVKVFPTFGNLDTFPAAQLGSGIYGSWILVPLSELMFSSGWVDNQTATFLKENGFYSYNLYEKLRIVVLNTEYTATANLWAWRYEFEKHHKMADWFNQELIDAKQNKEKVIIIGHIPLFDGMVYKKWNEEFVTTIQNHGDAVALQLFGHKHDDQFELQVTDDGIAVGVSLCSSSISTKTKKNPSLRLIEFDVDSMSVMDVKTFYNDVLQSNQDGTMEGNWHLEYSMKDAYGLKDFSPSSFQQFASTLESNQTVFDMFMLYYHASYKPVKKCEGDCKKKLLCETKYTLKERIDKCGKN